MNKKIVIVILVGIILLAASLSYLLFIPQTNSSSERINILFLGADARTPQTQGYTDSINILSIDKNTKEVSILSIPRDTRVQIAGKGVDKINSAYAYGDINTTKKTVENFLKVRIDYYVLVDFTDFKELVDSLGGITMNVEPHISAVRPELHGKTGVSKLTGDEALIYVRFRQDSESEGGRMKRHREAITAIINEALNPSNILQAPTVLNQLRKNVKTDIPPLETTVIEKLITGFNIDNAKTGVVTGEYTHINGINYMIPDMNKTEKTIIDLGLRN
ncbi:cell envelope-related transcriptional attenuator [Methanobacterium formicicum]|uniref:Cell envelope-related transcriptional attenuator n=1 Tax=Methanobacterium formicicum TaxID=2162 RepID=A0A089ZBX8_METFO|nr:LCP family protein [Methanobacterium formicicum]AIS31497.1 cell envelope-related transcriptional attenuator [Methanobacterium formicicum]